MNDINKLFEKTEEDFNERLVSLINELSDLVQIKSNLTKDESNKSNDESNDIALSVLQTTVEALAELLDRHVCALYFQSFYPLILELKKNINFIFLISSGDSKRNISELTYSNVNLNSVWETICYKMEKLIMNDMIKNNLVEELELERMCAQLRFLAQLKDNKSDNPILNEQGIEIWRLFDAIRVCRLESEVMEFCDKSIDIFLKRMVRLVSFEYQLYKNGYFGAYSLSYKELVIPYIRSVTTRLEAEISLLNTNVSDLIELLKNIIEFDKNLEEMREEFPRVMESPEPEELFNWKSLIELNVNINLFHKTIYNKINSDLRELNCFNSSSFDGCLALTDRNILSCVSKVFDNFEEYEYLCQLDSFMTFLSYVVSANITDFFVHHFKNGKYETIEQKYTLINTIHYIAYNLNKININVEKFAGISEKHIKEVMAKHVSILMLNNNNTKYWALYLNKLWLELKIKLNYYKNRETIYEFVLSETIHHYSVTQLETHEIVFILNNAINSLMKISYSQKAFLENNKNNIHNSCWILFIKLILKTTKNEEFISNLKQNNNLPENSGNTAVNHYIQYIRPKLMQSSFWFNTKLCIDKDFYEIHSKAIFRAFLSKSCGFSTYVLTDIDKNTNTEDLVIVTKDIFELILLQKFRPNLLSIVLLKLIERHNSWSEFDRTTVLSPGTISNIWWYRAFESIFTADIDKYLIHNLKCLINEALIASEVTQEIEDIYTSNDMIYPDMNSLVEEGLKILFKILNDLIQTLPITLISSLQTMNQSVPEYLNPIAKSLTLNVFVSSTMKRLKNCKFLNTDNPSEIELEFCQKLNSRFSETIEMEKNFCELKKTLELKELEKGSSLNNEELEIEIISSLVSREDQKFDRIFQRLHSLLLDYKVVIDRNISENSGIDSQNSFDITLINEKLIFEYNRQTDVGYDYNKILDLIDWEELENQIKLKFDYYSRLALFAD